MARGADPRHRNGRAGERELMQNVRQAEVDLAPGGVAYLAEVLPRLRAYERAYDDDDFDDGDGGDVEGCCESAIADPAIAPALGPAVELAPAVSLLLAPAPAPGGTSPHGMVVQQQQQQPLLLTTMCFNQTHYLPPPPPPMPPPGPKRQYRLQLTEEEEQQQEEEGQQQQLAATLTITPAAITPAASAVAPDAITRDAAESDWEESQEDPVISFAIRHNPHVGVMLGAPLPPPGVRAAPFQVCVAALQLGASRASVLADGWAALRATAPPRLYDSFQQALGYSDQLEERQQQEKGQQQQVPAAPAATIAPAAAAIVPSAIAPDASSTAIAPNDDAMAKEVQEPVVVRVTRVASA
jgi:hypothetical protein